MKKKPMLLADTIGSPKRFIAVGDKIEMIYPKNGEQYLVKVTIESVKKHKRICKSPRYMSLDD